MQRDVNLYYDKRENKYIYMYNKEIFLCKLLNKLRKKLFMILKFVKQIFTKDTEAIKEENICPQCNTKCIIKI